MRTLIRKLQRAFHGRIPKAARPRLADGWMGADTRVAIVKFQVQGQMPSLPGYRFWDVSNLGEGQFRVELRQETASGSRLLTGMLAPLVELDPSTVISMARSIIGATGAQPPRRYCI